MVVCSSTKIITYYLKFCILKANAKRIAREISVWRAKENMRCENSLLKKKKKNLQFSLSVVGYEDLWNKSVLLCQVLLFLSEIVSIKADKACTLEKTGSKEGAAVSVPSHSYINLDLLFLRRYGSFAQAIYCADPLVIVIATKYKNMHRIKKKNQCMWSS